MHNFNRTVITAIARCKNIAVCGLLISIISFNSFAELQFNKDIRPILSDKCFHCHGPDKADRKAGLRLDTAEGLVTDLGGYAAIVPGNPEASAVYKRITHSDPEERMPPAHMHKDLTEQEIATIYQWIKEGATYQNHWSFEPIAKPSLPQPSAAGPKIAIDFSACEFWNTEDNRAL